MGVPACPADTAPCPIPPWVTLLWVPAARVTRYHPPLMRGWGQLSYHQSAASAQCRARASAAPRSPIHPPDERGDGELLPAPARVLPPLLLTGSKFWVHGERARCGGRTAVRMERRCLEAKPGTPPLCTHSRGSRSPQTWQGFSLLPLQLLLQGMLCLHMKSLLPEPQGSQHPCRMSPAPPTCLGRRAQPLSSPCRAPGRAVTH